MKIEAEAYDSAKVTSDIPDWYKDEKYFPLFNHPVTYLEGLTVRSLSVLKGTYGEDLIYTVRDLCAMNAYDFLKRKNCGKHTLNNIRDVLDNYGLSLGMDVNMIDKYHFMYQAQKKSYDYDGAARTEDSSDSETE